MARNDISNRVRDSIHKNYEFKDVPSLITGAFNDLKDTFIFNQSWWLRDRVHEYSMSNSGNNRYDDVGLWFKYLDPARNDGVTSGHSHTIPEKRAELVLGLLNAIGRLPDRDVNTDEGCSNQNPTDQSKIPNTCIPDDLSLQKHIWDPTNWNAGNDTPGHPNMNTSSWPDDLRKPNWMHNQPPAFERTPFRPVFNIDFRDDAKSAVPAGGFLKQAHLTLTVSQQSIAWPREGYKAEFWKLIDDCDETCDWFYKKRPKLGGGLMTTSSLRLKTDLDGNTLGSWLNVLTSQPDGFGSGPITGITTSAHWLPSPHHPSLAPNSKWLFTSDYDSDRDGFWKRLNGDELGGWVYDPIDDSKLRCGSRIWIEHNSIIWPTIDTRYPFAGKVSVPKCRTVAIPTEYTATSSNQPIHQWLNQWNGQSIKIMDSWNFLKRAPETGGLTGCGGAVDIEEAGFVGSDQVYNNNLNEEEWYDYDGTLKVNPIGSIQPLTEFRPMRKENCREIHIPKFTNAGYTGSYYDLTTPSSSYGYATGPSGPADGRGITFSVDLGWWGRNAIAFSDQKLNLILKGEYNNLGDKDPNSKFESAKAFVEIPTPNQHLGTQPLSPFSSPFSGNPGNSNSTDTVVNQDPALPLTGTGAYPQTWAVNAGQIATNFYSVESPAPFTNDSLWFRSKGSILDIEFGNMPMQVSCFNSVTSPQIPYDQVKIDWNTSGPGFEGEDLRRRALNFVNTLSETDTFEFTQGAEISAGLGDHTTTGYVYKISPGSVTVIDNPGQGSVTFGVTGDQRLFPTLNNNIGPHDISERMTGRHSIITDDEHWIVSSSAWTSSFPTYTQKQEPAPKEIYPSLEELTEDDDILKDIFSPHPSGGYYPTGPDFVPIVGMNGGITGGGGSFIKLKRLFEDSPNNGSYTVLDVWKKDEVNSITREYVRVKEPLSVEQHPDTGQGLPFSIERVDHHPRIELVYRTKEQYDTP